MAGHHAFEQSGEVNRFDSRVSLGPKLRVKIVGTGDSWEPYALAAHVRF